MADNAMWLKNVRTGAKVLLAKYDSGLGRWCLWDSQEIEDGFDEHRPSNHADGDNDWRIEYLYEVK